MKEYTKVHAADDFVVSVPADDPFKAMRDELKERVAALKETMKKAPEGARVEAGIVLVEAAAILVAGAMVMGLPQ